MQTFLPYPDFAESARCLDDKRLGKQRVEARQILRVLTHGPKIIYRFENLTQGILSRYLWDARATEENVENLNKSSKVARYSLAVTPWWNHPAVLMWRGYNEALAAYGDAMISEWEQIRNYRNSMAYLTNPDLKYTLPTWIGDSAFHLSHRQALAFKKPEFYIPMFQSKTGEVVKPLLDYHWPKSADICF